MDISQSLLTFTILTLKAFIFNTVLTVSKWREAKIKLNALYIIAGWELC